MRMIMCMCIHMTEELKVINELIKSATKINAIRRNLKRLGFNENEISEMVDHFVIEKINQPMEDI